jgi:two-component system, cell cycle response regulator DivK
MMNIPENILKGWTVLVVEDEPDSAEVASILLQMYGATVVVARNGREGLEMIHQHRPRFVITDLTMPDMNGWEMTEALKVGDRVVASIPVIALTAHAMNGDRNRALKTGFLNYLTKPLKPDTFVSQLLELLAYDIPELKQVLEQSNP